MWNPSRSLVKAGFWVPHAVEDVAALQVSELDRRLVTVQESTQALEDGIYEQVQTLCLQSA